MTYAMAEPTWPRSDRLEPVGGWLLNDVPLLQEPTRSLVVHLIWLVVAVAVVVGMEQQGSCWVWQKAPAAARQPSFRFLSCGFGSR